MKRILGAVLAGAVWALMAPGAARGQSLPEPPAIVITRAEAAKFFGKWPAKFLVQGEAYTPAGRRERAGALYLLDFSRPEFELELVCDGATVGDLEPYISPDGTRVVYGVTPAGLSRGRPAPGSTYDESKIYVVYLAKGGPGKRDIGDGYEPRWWVHPKTGDEYIISVNCRWDNSTDITGQTFIQQIKKGTCEPAGPRKILIRDYAFRGGRSPNGRYMCTSIPGGNLCEFKDPLAVENAEVTILNPEPIRTICNGSMPQNDALGGKMIFEDKGHGGINFGVPPYPPQHPGVEHVGLPGGTGQLQRLEWSTHPDFVVGQLGSRANRGDPAREGLYFLKWSTREWQQVTRGGEACHLWVATASSPAASTARTPASSGRTAGSSAAEVPAWPANRRGLVFQTTDKASDPFYVFDATGGRVPGMTLELVSEGLAMSAYRTAMRLEGGRFEGGKIGLILTSSVRRGGGFTAEMVIQPRGPASDGVIAALDGQGGTSVALAQRGDRLVFQVRAAAPGAAPAEAEVGSIEAGRPVHLVVAYRPGNLEAWVDGKRAAQTDALREPFIAWDTGAALVFGSAANGSRPWRGLVGAAAFFSRPLAEAEAAKEFDAAKPTLEALAGAATVTVEAKLVRRSAFQTPEEDPGYRNAYAVNDYEVVRVVSGSLEPTHLRVAQWVWVGRKLVRTSAIAVGQTYTLALEPLADHPAVEQQRTFDDGNAALDAPVYYDVGPVEVIAAN